jgi:hypothetical protein
MWSISISRPWQWPLTERIHHENLVRAMITRGLPMRWEVSSIISFQCAIQPAVRAIAYSAVNISEPSAF